MEVFAEGFVQPRPKGQKGIPVNHRNVRRDASLSEFTTGAHGGPEAGEATTHDDDVLHR